MCISVRDRMNECHGFPVPPCFMYYVTLALE